MPGHARYGQPAGGPRGYGVGRSLAAERLADTTKGSPVENPARWEGIVAARTLHALGVQRVRGRSGHPLNERVNTLAQAAAALGAG